MVPKSPQTKPTRRRQSKPGGKTTSPKGLTESQLEERRSIVFEMRARQCLSFREIAARVTAGGSGRAAFAMTAKTAFDDYWSVMERDVMVASDDLERHRATELHKCDQMEAGLASDAMGGDPSAVNSFLRVMQRRARLLGLDAPTQVSGPGGGPIRVEDVGVSDQVLASIVARTLEPSAN